MTVGVTEEQVRGWGAGLEGFIAGVFGLFARPEPRVTFAAFIRALLGDVPRKNGWQVAAHAGWVSPDRQQKLLSEASWDADALRDVVRERVVAGLGRDGAVWVVDETAALKKGTESVGVSRQYAGVTGQVENCQTMVMLTWAAAAGHSFIDRALYLPRVWASDPERMARAKVPAGVGFATKPQLAIGMLARGLAAGLRAPIAADGVYGQDRKLRRFCHENKLTYVMHVPGWTLVELASGKVRADGVLEVLAGLDGDGPVPWRRYTGAAGSKGLRRYDWAWIGGIGLDAEVAQGFEQTLLARRSTSDPDDVCYLLAHAPADTPLIDLIRIDAARWTVEEDNKTGKGEVGLDHYEVRTWRSWHRHVTCAMFAAAFLAITRAAENTENTENTEAGKDQAATAGD